MSPVMRPMLAQDGAAAVKHLRDKGVPAASIVLHGHSMVVIWLGLGSVFRVRLRFWVEHVMGRFCMLWADSGTAVGLP